VVTAGKTDITSITFDLFGTLLTIDEARVPEIVIDGQCVRSLLAAPISYLRHHEPKADMSEFLVGYLLATARAQRVFEQGDNRELPPDWAFTQALKRLGTSNAMLSTSLAASLMEATIQAAVQAPGTSAVLRELRHRGYSLGLISNFADVQSGWRLLARIGIAESFDTVVFSGHVSWRKPDARVFAEALRRLGVLPSAVIHVGDELRADVYGAGRAGIAAIWINPDRAVYKGDVPPLLILTTLAELPTCGVLQRCRA
jgi:HAD superfamily hydrolase (TIGR01509 family)